MRAHEITEVTVKRALDALLDSPTNQEQGLLNLDLVDRAIRQMRLADTRTCRSYALSTLLTDLITCQYRTMRCANGLPDPELITSNQSSLDAITHDVRTGNITLIGWSWVYTRYVRPELSISAPHFCEAAGVHVRTLQRYFQRTLSQLAARLIEVECQPYVMRRWKVGVSESLSRLL